MIYLLFLISLFSSFFIGLGLGGRGVSKNKIINYGSVAILIVTVIEFFYSIKFGFISTFVNIIVLYGTAFIFNKKYKGLDQINNQIDSEKFKKQMENLLKTKK